MGLLSTSTQISWSEPWFFLVRIRTLRGWLKRIAIALCLGLLVFAGLYFFDNARFDVLQLSGICLAFGGGILLLMDRPNIQRDVSVDKESIFVSSSAGRGWAWSKNFPFDEIESIQLMRSEEWDYSVDGMLIDHGEENDFLVAVPRKVSLETLANVLYRLDLAVSLTGWEPPQGDTRLAVKDELPIDRERAVGIVDALSIEGVEPKLMSPVQIGIQLVIALGPLLLGLIGAIASGVYLYRNWNDLEILNRCLIGGAGFVGLVAGLFFLITIGQFIAAGYGIRVGRTSMQRRTESLFSGLEDDLVAVEVYSPEKWTTPGMSDDFGFLQIDRSQRLLRFEGNKNRWTLPFGALKSCRIQEGILGSEGNPNAEKRYYVILAADQEDADEDWEYGLIYVRTEIGNDTPVARYDRSRLLFSQLADAI